MSRSGRVLLIANNFPPVRGGSAVVYTNVAGGAAGHVTVLAPRFDYVDGLQLVGWREHDQAACFRVVRLALLRTTMRIRRGGLQRVRFRLEDVVIRGRVALAVLGVLLGERARAVCIGELVASGWLVLVLRHVPGLRTLVYVHGEEITTEDAYDPGRRRRRRVLRAADGIVVVSRFAHAAVLGLLGAASAGKVRLIENGVDVERFVAAPKRPDLMELFGLDGHFVFVSVCRLLEKKGIDQALRAFAEIDDADARFLVVGTGPYEPALHALAAALGLAGRVVFAGEVSEESLADFYRLGDVFVMPNRSLPNGDTEGFGLVFLEANGCGLPVIAGRDGGSTDAVQDGINGLVVDGHSVEAIAAAMRRLRGDPALCARLRQAGLDRATRAGWTEKARDFLAFATIGPSAPEGRKANASGHQGRPP